MKTSKKLYVQKTKSMIKEVKFDNNDLLNVEQQQRIRNNKMEPNGNSGVEKYNDQSEKFTREI